MATNYIHNNINDIFAILQRENSKNIVYTEEYNIPVSNNYYTFIIDPSDSDYKNILSTINRIGLTDIADTDGGGGGGDDGGEMTISSGIEAVPIEEEQIFDIKILNKNIKEIDLIVDSILECINESSGLLHLVIDIDLLLTLFKQFHDKDCETHIIDFILFKFKNKVDYLYIYSKNNLIKNQSLLHKQILECLKNEHIIINSNNDAYTHVIYKNINNTYWYIDAHSGDNDGGCGDDGEEDILSVEVNANDIMSNIFDKDSNLYVLNPYDKNKLYFL
jgi:hypothetical protein